MKNDDHLTESEWITQTQAGDNEAFSRLVEKYQRPVYNLCYQMLGDRVEAEDAAQEVFIRAYYSLHTYDETRSKFSTWLYAVASHYCIDKLRLKRLKLVSWDDLAAWYRFPVQDNMQPEKALLTRETSQEVQTLLKTLPPDYQAAIIMRYWHYQSYQDIAQTLDTTVSAIKSKLFRARKMMAKTVIQQEASKQAYNLPILAAGY